MLTHKMFLPPALNRFLFLANSGLVYLPVDAVAFREFGEKRRGSLNFYFQAVLPCVCVWGFWFGRCLLVLLRSTLVRFCWRNGRETL